MEEWQRGAQLDGGDRCTMHDTSRWAARVGSETMMAGDKSPVELVPELVPHCISSAGEA